MIFFFNKLWVLICFIFNIFGLFCSLYFFFSIICIEFVVVELIYFYIFRLRKFRYVKKFNLLYRYIVYFI